MARVCIFVDGSNFYHQLKTVPNHLNVIDYYELSKILTLDEDLVRMYYYIFPIDEEVTSEAYQGQQRFITHLHHTPYMQAKVGHRARNTENQVEKGVDVQLCVDMVALAYENAYDKAILISNDSDMVPAVETVKRLGKHVLYGYISTRTQRLVEVCDNNIEINYAMLEKCQPVQTKNHRNENNRSDAPRYEGYTRGDMRM